MCNSSNSQPKKGQKNAKNKKPKNCNYEVTPHKVSQKIKQDQKRPQKSLKVPQKSTKKKYFKNYQVNSKLMNFASKEAIFMH